MTKEQYQKIEQIVYAIMSENLDYNVTGYMMRIINNDIARGDKTAEKNKLQIFLSILKKEGPKKYKKYIALLNTEFENRNSLSKKRGLKDATGVNL